MRVSNWMQRDVKTLTEESSLRDAINLSRKHSIRHILIVRDQTVLVGIVSDRDIKRFAPSISTEQSAEEHERVLEETTLGRIMTRDPSTVTPSTELHEAVDILCERRFGALPVVEDGKLVGILSETDMLRAFRQLLTHGQRVGPGEVLAPKE